MKINHLCMLMMVIAAAWLFAQDRVHTKDAPPQSAAGVAQVLDTGVTAAARCGGVVRGRRLLRGISTRTRGGISTFTSCLQRIRQLDHWLERAIRFEGMWRAEEVALVVDTLDRLSATLGEERFLDLSQAAVRPRWHGGPRPLTFARGAGQGRPPASWTPQLGLITLHDSLFDEDFMATDYRWVFLDDWRRTLPREITVQEAVIAHEIGHMLLDALETERNDDLSLEALYGAKIDQAMWPHPDYDLNENVATEIALWGLRMARPVEVEVLRELHLASALKGEE